MASPDSWKQRHSNLADQSRAEAVFRSVTHADGKIKDHYLPLLVQLNLKPQDLADL
jgi:predicted Holliday junction resolvase-like endonuclease